MTLQPLEVQLFDSRLKEAGSQKHILLNIAYVVFGNNVEYRVSKPHFSTGFELIV